MLGLSKAPFHVMLLRKLNTWYTVCDGNWSDPTIWMSNGLDKKNVLLPRAGVNVVINHNVTYDNQNLCGYTFNQSINNLTINGKLLWGASLNASQLWVTGNLQCPGTVDLSGSTGGGGAKIIVSGVVNYIANFVTGNSTSNITIYYNSPLSFVIPNVNYYNLQIGGGNIKSTS